MCFVLFVDIAWGAFEGYELDTERGLKKKGNCQYW